MYILSFRWSSTHAILFISLNSKQINFQIIDTRAHRIIDFSLTIPDMEYKLLYLLTLHSQSYNWARRFPAIVAS